MTKPNGAHGTNAIGEHPGLVVLGLRAPFLRAEKKAVVCRAHASFGVRVGQEVTGDLFDRETVKSLIVVQALDDPITIGPNIARIVAVIADRVGEPNRVQPADRHSLAVVGAGQEIVDKAFVGVGRIVLKERLDHLGGWW